jgi:thymidine kinase
MKLTFFYATMMSGKTEAVLKACRDAEKAKKKTLVLVPSKEERNIGDNVKLWKYSNYRALVISKTEDLEALFLKIRQEENECGIELVLVDDAQFLTQEQVIQLSNIVDHERTSVICYGLRMDSNGKLFEGSLSLLAMSDKIKEISSMCHCGAKTNMVLRFGDDGEIIKNGDQIHYGEEGKNYVSVCRYHWKEGNIGLEEIEDEDFEQ